jgi:hypothetical protein
MHLTVKPGDMQDAYKMPSIPHTRLKGASHKYITIFAHDHGVQLNGGGRIRPPGARAFPHLRRVHEWSMKKEGDNGLLSVRDEKTSHLVESNPVELTDRAVLDLRYF